MNHPPAQRLKACSTRIASGRDALELVLAGANGISVGTASFGNPTAIIEIQEQLRQLLIDRGFNSFSESVSFAHRTENQ